MTPEIMLLFVLSGIALISFALEKIPADVTALGLMLALVLTGILTPAEAFTGFGSETVLMILGLLIMTTALHRTGVVDIVGQIILRLTDKRPGMTLPVVTIAIATLSAFISNTAATAFFLPVIIGFARKSQQSPSRFLLPMAFASILTSSVTLISTSTNIVISEMMTRYKLAPLGMFELTPVGLPISILGIIYLLTLGVRLMPDRAKTDESDSEFGLKPYLTEIALIPDSPQIGKKLMESEIITSLRMNVIRIIRGGKYLIARGTTVLAESDVLLVEGSKESILAIKDLKGLDIKPEAQLLDAKLDSSEVQIVEAIVPYNSQLVGRTLKSLDFRNRYDIIVLAINKSGLSTNKKMSDTPLKTGDVLLLQGQKQEIQLLNDSNLVTIIGKIAWSGFKFGKAPIAVAAFLVCLALATLKIISFPVATLLGAFAVLVTGCISPEESYRDVDWKVLILIGSMLSLGTAMEKTGAGIFLSKSVLNLTGTDSVMILVTVFFLFSLVITQIMSNQAAAIVLVPVALPTAASFGIDPRGLIATIAVAASCSYLTPLEPSCLMVYGPGKYRFRDFLIVGAPLTILIYVITVFMVPLVWPFSR